MYVKVLSVFGDAEYVGVLCVCVCVCMWVLSMWGGAECVWVCRVCVGGVLSVWGC